MGVSYVFPSNIEKKMDERIGEKRVVDDEFRTCYHVVVTVSLREQ